MKRPCAVCTRTWRRILKRSRTTCARFSRISDRLPPVSRWMRTAVTKKRTSSSRDALRHLVQRVAQRQAEVLLIERLLELGADRLRQFLGHHAERGLERVAGADGARQQVERFGKLLLEFLQPRRPPVQQTAERRERADARRRRAARTAAERTGTRSRRRAPRQMMLISADRAGRRPHAGLLDQARHALAERRSPETRRSMPGSGPSSVCFRTDVVVPPSDRRRPDRPTRRCSRRSSRRAASTPGSIVTA